MKTKTLLFPIALLGLVACGGGGNASSTGEASKTNSASSEGESYFIYSPTDTKTIGSKTNEETHYYDKIKVNPVEKELRKDFAMGVDASMVQTVEDAGGVYYNAEGKEQDIFEILRDNGVNFVRFRLWNNPERKVGHHGYGGGNNSYATDLKMAKRAEAAGLNVMIDFHYSDFWADPDYQQCPKAWQDADYDEDNDEIPALVKEFTKDTLDDFAKEGVSVDAVQIGNEINNGIAGYSINWNDTDSSFDYMAKVLKAGIEGAKSSNPDVKTLIHLANGGNKAEFETFFTAMDKRKVDYDIIGASFYPYLAGSLEDLQNNLDNVSKLTGKPVMVVETSWGYTTEYNAYTANQYTKEDEDVGGYLTSEQGQATAVRDIINVLSKVPDSKGLGVFYWEPAWLPVNEQTMWASRYGQSYQYTGNDSTFSDYTDGLATWSNQGLFSYSGKALASLQTFGKVREGFNKTEETSTKIRKDSASITLNIAANETLPSGIACETNLDAIRNFPATYDSSASEQVKKKGTYEITATVDGKYSQKLTVNCIENFIVDPGFENQGETDVIKDPWKIASVSPADDKVAKLDRKKDIRSGKTDLNWYHSSSDFSFDVYQEVELPAGTYTLSTYIMAVAPSKAAHETLDVYIVLDGKESKVDMKDVVDGWGVPDHYHEAKIDDIVVSGATKVKVGIRGAAKAGAWGHNDDWSLVSKD
ncbi:MAG: arabinogalactan endo-1,4-beta-galactosidase [Bacilli bacterium]|nr:arabinogalactan endo-1,4-beta-galactosidase [Bacilli bacterium]